MGFVSFAALFNGCLERMSPPDMACGGAGAARRAEQRCTDMLWQMADWRLSLWKNMLGSQLVEGRVTCRWVECSSFIISASIEKYFCPKEQNPIFTFLFSIQNPV